MLPNAPGAAQWVQPVKSRARALHCVVQYNLTDTKTPQPSTYSPLIQSGPLFQVAPNSTDVFYVAAAALMGIVYQGCGVRIRPFYCMIDQTGHAASHRSGIQLNGRLVYDTWRADGDHLPGLRGAFCNPRYIQCSRLYSVREGFGAQIYGQRELLPSSCVSSDGRGPLLLHI